MSNSCSPHLVNVRGGQRCERCGTFYKVPHGVTIRGVACKFVDLEGKQEPVKCIPCEHRQAAANETAPRLGDRIAALADPVANAVGWKERNLLLHFQYGLGDDVQFCVVLRHIRRLHPKWKIDVIAAPRSHEMFRRAGARYCYTDRSQVVGEYVFERCIRIVEPTGASEAHPVTKAEMILQHYFGITPRPELCVYRVGYGWWRHTRAVKRYLRSIETKPKEFCLVHYQGDSAKSRKNIPEEIAAECVQAMRDAGYRVLVFDYDRRSQLVDGRDVLRVDLPTDPCYTAAIANLSRFNLGIDSGPGHVFGSTTVKAPAVIYWRKHHPYHFNEPADHVLHVLPRSHWQYVHGDEHDQRVAAGFTFRRYRTHQIATHAREELPQVIADHLAGSYQPTPRWTPFGKMNHRTLLDRLGEPPDVFVHCGVGPRPHCEAEQIHQRWPDVSIVGFEPDRETFADRVSDYPGTLHRCAVGRKPGRVKLYPGAADPGMASTLPAAEEYSIDYGRPYRVKVARIDDLAPPCRRAFLWLDIEGGELEALCGAERVLRGTRWIYVEVSERSRRQGEPTGAELDAFLAARGFVEVHRSCEGDVSNRLYQLKPAGHAADAQQREQHAAAEEDRP